ncbi:GxxExxY protein [Chitinophagaceae bacterium LWZ2-11]
MFERLSDKEEKLAKQVVDISMQVHKALGPGLLESVYEKCFCHLLEKRNISYQRQKLVPIVFDGLLIDAGLKLDLLIDDLLILELKAQDEYHPIWEAQLLSYLKLTERRLGFIINFHVPLIKTGIKRMIL